ncbi:FMN-binding negative transcriptional regulator [Cohnella endophytica]|uniref:FMN-binding negative transcriptional regulator n=1 Tax=Cohnella endophytica TaxID=2419778 RepID=A0A494YD85_9BACL|nr:FMN-binding negative transcriptional regulator [Cohnella endophytica]RKP58241.1 FMN-binding negative transcriptional regulator [Cohnella endophytica]
MYVPKAYQMKDWEMILEFIEQNSFGILISNSNTLTATHLPFLVKTNGNEIYLYSHMAKANPQWKELSGEALIIFNGPQSYITPTWYAEKEVPTWDYVTAHLYGEFQLVPDTDEILDILNRTINNYEAESSNAWKMNEVSEEYINQLLKRIVGFRIRVTHWEAAWKLHQDYSLETKNNVIRALELRGDDNSKQLAELMKKVNGINSASI